MQNFKLKELRKKKAWSQEQLSTESGLSLRTIQRIENGESEPTGHSLLQLTQALGVSPDEIMEWAPAEDKGYLIVLNLTALTFLLHPLLGIILPLVMYILKREHIRRVEDTGRKQLSFMISWGLVIYMILTIAAAGRFIIFSWDLADTIRSLFVEPGWITLSLNSIYIFMISIILINVRLASRGKSAWYKPAIPFLK